MRAMPEQRHNTPGQVLPLLWEQVKARPTERRDLAIRLRACRVLRTLWIKGPSGAGGHFPMWASLRKTRASGNGGLMPVFVPRGGRTALSPLQGERGWGGP